MIEKLVKIEELLKNNLNGKIIDQEVTRLTQPGENYLSIVLKVDVKIRNGNDGKEETLSTVAKVVPPQADGDMHLALNFKNEIAWYTHIMPAIREYQKEHGVKNVADFFAKMYGSRLSLDPKKDTPDENAVIVLENLKIEGYENVDRLVGFDLETAKAIIRDLATFHAVPIAMKLENRELFEKKIKSRLTDFMPPPPPPQNDNEGPPKGPPFAEEASRSLERILKENPECAILWHRVKPFITSNFPPPMNVREPWGTVTHSDFWVNNIMLKPQNSGPPKIKIVDFQMTPYKSPLSDFIFFLFSSVQTHVLQRNFDYFLKYYYDQFIQNLKELKADINLFTYKSYLSEIETVAKEGELGHSLSFLFIVLAPRGIAPDVMEVGFSADMMTNIFKRDICQTQKERTWFAVRECCKRDWI